MNQEDDGNHRIPVGEIDWNDWSDWTPLLDFDFKSISTGPGAYVIATDRPLNRAIGVDENGFLDIGESQQLRQRLRSFIRCASRRGDEGHMAGWRYAFFHFDSHYPLSSLRLRWIEVDSKERAYQEEGQLLFVYLRRHAELPPLNYKFNWQVFEQLGWDILDKLDE